MKTLILGKFSSDIHFWKHGRIGTLVFEGDCIIGHEAAGVVLRCGEGVTEFQPGMKSAPEEVIYGRVLTSNRRSSGR